MDAPEPQYTVSSDKNRNLLKSEFWRFGIFHESQTVDIRGEQAGEDVLERRSMECTNKICSSFRVYD